MQDVRVLYGGYQVILDLLPPESEELRYLNFICVQIQIFAHIGKHRPDKLEKSTCDLLVGKRVIASDD